MAAGFRMATTGTGMDWCDLVKKFGRTFKRVAGTSEHLAEEARRPRATLGPIAGQSVDRRQSARY